MRQKLYPLIVIVSAAASLLVAGLWLRERTSADKWFMQHIVPGKSQGVTYIQVTSVELSVENSWRPEFPGATPGELAWEIDSAGWQIEHTRTSGGLFYPGLRDAGHAGFAWFRYDTKLADRTGKVVGAETYRGLLLPIWALFVASMLPAALVIGRWSVGSWVGRRRRQSGRCERCGYDLRGGTGECPECGQSATARPAPPTAAA